MFVPRPHPLATRHPAHLAAVAALALTLLAALLPAALAAQERPAASQSDIEVVLDRSQRARLRLAQPSAEGRERLSGQAATAARELEATLRADLEASGVFEIQGPAQLAVLSLTGETERDFELYRSLGNEILLETTMSQEGDRLVLEGRLFELSSQRNLLAKRYRGGIDVARRIAHTFSDEIVEFFTGRKGVALTSIAFHTDREGNGTREIYVMDYDGWNQRPVTQHKTLSMSPDFAPSGDELAYVSYVTRAPGIHLADLRTGRKTHVLVDGDLNISPAFSPDGKQLAVARSVGDGNIEIFVCDRDGSNLRRLTHSRGIDTNPAWSPTGRELAFTSNRAGSPQIYVMSAEGTDLRRATFEGDYNDGAAWSPDGTRLAHATRRGNSFDLALTDLVTLESLRIPAGPGSHEAPAFSPDGRKLAFASTRDAGSERMTQIYVMDLDGSNVRQLTTEGNNSAPSWSRIAN